MEPQLTLGQIARMFEKYGPIPLTRAIIREKMRYLGHDFWMNDDRYGGLEKMGWRRVGRSYFGFKRFGDVVSF